MALLELSGDANHMLKTGAAAQERWSVEGPTSSSQDELCAEGSSPMALRSCEAAALSRAASVRAASNTIRLASSSA